MLKYRHKPEMMKLLLPLLVALLFSALEGTLAFSSTSHVTRHSSVKQRLLVRVSEGAENEENTAENEDNDDDQVVQSVVRMDDGGSDLSDRFKYKVNALMGVFDAQAGADDERHDGNILNAMLKFPVRYSFIVVGKTSGKNELKDKYVEEVKSIVASLSGDGDRMECQVIPRGKSFTRVTLQVTVDSVTIINSIYDALDKVELTVIRY